MTVYEEPVWEAPTRTRKPRKYEKVLTPLMESPEEWGKIAEYKSEGSAYQASTNLRKGKYLIPEMPEDWEFVSDGTAVFARYISDRTNGEKPAAQSD